MAYSIKKKIELNGKSFWKVEVMEYRGIEQVHLDKNFVFGYCYQNEQKKVIHRAFEIKGVGECLDPNCYVKKTNTGQYLIRWRGIDDNKYQIITTVHDL